MQNKKQKIIERGIDEEMKSAYIDYAMSVIVSRAIPDVRDGLKPVQRRILYSMYEDGLNWDGKFKKAATVVGSCLGRYHPHGDQPVYDAAIRMAQDFTLRYPLIAGQGNIGSLDDPGEYAAMRYVEMKLSRIGEELLRDIEKETVDFTPNYDGTRKEPVVLPSPLPQLLLNGSLGIAVGMATNIPPHNLRELCDALIFLLDHPQADTQELFTFIHGPDFPTGGFIFDKEEIIKSYSQGRGPIVVRGKAEIVDGERGRKKILITEIPYQVSKSQLLEELANLVSEKKIDGIKDIRDESDREGLRITIELEKDAQANQILHLMYKYTQLEKVFHLNMVALVEGIQPKILNLAEALNAFLAHRKEVVYRRTKYDLERAKEKAHILDGLSKCLDKIDLVIKLIRSSETREIAKERLMKYLKIDAIQANAILEMKLASLARLERTKIFRELTDTKEKIKRLESVLKSPRLIKEEIKNELLQMKEKYGDERKTKMIDQKITVIKDEDLIPPEETIIVFTNQGFIKRVDPKEYKMQKRGGRGILGAKTKEDDFVKEFILANTRDRLLVFTNQGRVFSIPVYDIPKEKREGRGRSIFHLLEVSKEEEILTFATKGENEESKYLIFATLEGKIKKTRISEFSNIRRTGIIAIALVKGDRLKSVKKSGGEDEILIITQNGQAIRFKEKEVREMGRMAEGIRGIRLKSNDKVAEMEVISKGRKFSLITISENGFGKRVNGNEIKIQKRGGTGIRIAKIVQKTGRLIGAKIIDGEEEIILISERGKVLKTQIASIPKFSRHTIGVRVMKLDDDKISSFLCI